MGQLGQRAATLWSSRLFRMLWLLVVCVGLVVGQEVTDEVLDNINEPSGIALKDSFRCGLFFPDPADKSPDKSALPYLNLYIFNATFDAKSECDSGTPNVKRYNDFCAQVWDKGGKGFGAHLPKPQQEESRRRCLDRGRYLQLGED